MSEPTPDHGGNGKSPDNPFDFDAADAADLTPREVRGIKWLGNEYVLREGSADACIKLTNARLRVGILDNNRLVGANGGAEIPYQFVAACLFRVTQRGDGGEALQPVSEQQLKAHWKHSFVLSLFDEAVRISRIEKGGTKKLAPDAGAEASADPLPV